MMKMQPNSVSPAQRASVFLRSKLQEFEGHKLSLGFLVDLIPWRHLVRIIFVLIFSNKVSLF